jgi:hypothetical protein
MIRSSRRPARLAVLLMAATAMALPATALANPTSGLDMAATLLDQPAGGPWAVNLSLGAHFGSDDGGIPPILTNMSFKFPHAKVNGSQFPTCTLAKLKASGPSGCPSGSRIGQGRAIVDAIGLKIGATIMAFNGPGSDSNRQEVIYAKADPGIDVTLYFAGTLKKIAGQYGYQLDIAVPAINTIPGAPDASIDSFNVNVGGRLKKHGRKISYIDAPTVCPSAGLPFAGSFKFRDGTSSSASATISCTLKAV